MSIFKRIPIPLCAVALGMFGLGNLLQSYSEGIRLLWGAVAAVLLLLFLISVIVDFKKFWGEMKNPIMALSLIHIWPRPENTRWVLLGT